MRHGRSFPIRPHLPPAIVGAPIVVWTAPQPLVVSQQARQCAVRLRNGPRLRPRLPPAIVGAAPPPPPPPDPIVTRSYMLLQATNRARQLFGAVPLRPVVSPPIIDADYFRDGATSQLVTIRAGIEIDA